MAEQRNPIQPIATAQKQTVYTPLFQWKNIHCKHCKRQCTPASEAYQRCILAHIALNLEQLRIITQQRTQHLSW